MQDPTPGFLRSNNCSIAQLLIIDDWGLTPFSDIEGRDFLEVMEDIYNIRSTMIVTQFPVDKWHEIIGDPTIADAICDRLVHNAYHITKLPHKFHHKSQ